MLSEGARNSPLSSSTEVQYKVLNEKKTKNQTQNILVFHLKWFSKFENFSEERNIF